MTQRKFLNLVVLRQEIGKVQKRKKQFPKGVSLAIMQDFVKSFSDQITRAEAQIISDDDNGVTCCSVSDGKRIQKQLVIPTSCFTEIRSPAKNLQSNASEFARLM